MAHDDIAQMLPKVLHICGTYELSNCLHLASNNKAGTISNDFLEASFNTAID